ncbi:capsule biosynthesis protein [Sphingomonas sp. MMS24-J13]|uniref:capsule biosynthesis protein n=1 Tax=Sphingomonas sp. MMS24-J13 TaxID=3238686 RepID=UPI00385102BC
MPRREFLFLQGLAGPFFSRLGQALAERGHGVHRVNFNGGDKIYWRGPNAVDYRWGLGRWPSFLTALLQERGITDLVLFGDCRPLHEAAIAVAKRLGLQVHVFEEGYIRPDFVTLEAGGVNGHSRLSRDPEYYLEAARALPPMPQLGGLPSSFARRAWEDVSYNLASLALVPLFPGYRTHRPWHILHEYFGWVLRLLRKKAETIRSAATLERLEASGKPYFVFPLQLTDDYQIRVHSQFDGIEPAIELVMASFARHAPDGTVLLVKGHPLDNGLVDWEKRTLAIAARLGISERVFFLETADIDIIVRSAQGVVTVNSTTGTLSLRHGVPTIVLGDAVYDIPRITHQGGLDCFWTTPTPPEAPVFDAFRSVLVDRCLVHGGYFSEFGLAMLVAGSITRLEAAEAPLPVMRLVGSTRPQLAAIATQR